MRTAARLLRVAIWTTAAVATTAACDVLAPARTAPAVETLETCSRGMPR